MTMVVGGISVGLHRAKEDAIDAFLRARSRKGTARRGLWRTTPALDTNLRGIGVGRKRRRGRALKKICVQFLVVHKHPEHSVPPAHRVPREWNGFPTDVVEVGDVAPLGLRDRARPAGLGMSIGAVDGIDATFGTLGAVVRYRDGAGGLAILSCSHVLTDWERFPVGTPILQPACVDGGSEESDVIAHVSNFAALVQGRRGLFDAAIANVVDSELVANVIPPSTPPIVDRSPLDPIDGMKVHKVGMVTGLTRGSAFSVGTALEVNTRDPEIGDVLLEDQFLVRDSGRPFSNTGDSGALVVASDTGRPCGLLAARTTAGFSVVNRLSALLDLFRVDLVY